MQERTLDLLIIGGGITGAGVALQAAASGLETGLIDVYKRQDYYMETEDQEDLSGETFDNLFVSILAKEKWDLILFVQPVGSYVNDGFRDMTMAEDHIRYSFSQHLDQMRERYLTTCLLYTST